MSVFRLGVLQLTSTDQVSANLAQIEGLYRSAAKQGVDLVVGPENSLFLRLPGSQNQHLEWNGHEMERIQAWVERAAVPLMLTTAVRRDGQVRNSTLLFGQGQEPRVLYSKIHMFDVDVEGAPPVRESDHFVPGREPAIAEVKGWKFGLSICYDLRFSELYSHYAQKVDVILVPSAFLVPTGEAHWQVLLRARAIENQCFVAAPAQSGEHRSSSGVRQTFGHSLVVDPWGKVLTEMLESPAGQIVELERALIDKVRRQIPMAGHRRGNML